MTKIAVVTGTGKGLGLALCKKLLSDGYTVCALEKSPTDALLSLERECDEIHVFECDVTDAEAIERCGTEIEKMCGSIDLLINNAGVWLDKERNKINAPSFDDDIRLCYTEFDINTMGTLRIIKRFLPLLMKEANENRAVVNLSSDCASYNAETNPRAWEYAYCISKAGVNIISNLLANTLKETDIKVLSVFPGWMQTDMGFAGVTDKNVKPNVSPEEAADCILKLIKDKKKDYTYCNRFGERMY